MKMNKLLVIGLAALPLMLGCNSNGDAKKVCDEANAILNENKDNIRTCHDAVVLLGNKLSKSFEFKDGSEFVYDAKSKQMVIMKNDAITYASNGYQKSDNTLDYFKFVSTYNPNSKYSQYLKKSAIETDTLYVTTGFDSGYHKDIKNIKYNNYSGNKRNVILRTYCDYLTIDAPDDTISHYSDATNVIINKVDTLNVYGAYAYMKARNGNINFGYSQDDSMTDLFEVPEGYESNVKTKVLDDNAYVYGLINWSSIEGMKKDPKILKCDVAKDAATLSGFAKSEDENRPDYIKLTNDISYTYSDSLQFNRPVSIDLNGHKLTFNNSTKSLSSQIREAMRVQSDVNNDKSLYIFDSQDYLDENSGINLINCSIVVSGVSDSSQKTSNLVINSGIIKQTITSDFTSFTELGGAITCIGNTSGEEARNAYIKTYGGRIVCDNQTKISNVSGCIGAIGVGANIDVVYGSLISNDYCIYSSKVSSANLGNANIVVEGGSVTSTENTCLYFPLNATVKIDGGKLNGMSCINLNTGNVTINNSTLNATGQHFSYGEKNYDGSPIYAPKDADSGNLSMTITGSTLNSKFGYIVDVVGDSLVKGNTTIDCKDGTYNYYLGNGISQECPNTTITTAGTWTKRDN